MSLSLKGNLPNTLSGFTLKHIHNEGSPQFWWLVRATLLVAFGFLSQNYGKWQGPTNGTLSFYEWIFRDLGGGDTPTLPYAKEFV